MSTPRHPRDSRTVARLARLALTVLVVVSFSGCGGPTGPTLATGTIVPDFDLARLEGGRLERDDLAGGTTPVILNFWATWCGPCVREIPALQAVHEQGAARVIAIAVDEGPAIVRPFVAKQGMGYPVLIGDMATFGRFGGRAIPYTVILDTDLVVRRVHTGLVSQRTLERDLATAREALSEPTAR